MIFKDSRDLTDCYSASMGHPNMLDRDRQERFLYNMLNTS